MRILEISPAARRRAAKVVAYAKKRKNWYNPTVAGWIRCIPGHDKDHQCKLNTFRCVFSYTIFEEGRVVRHLTVSVPGGKFPHTLAVREIAKMFGFTGASENIEEKWPEDWIVQVKQDDPIDDDCISIGQDTGIRI